MSSSLCPACATSSGFRKSVKNPLRKHHSQTSTGAQFQPLSPDKFNDSPDDFCFQKHVILFSSNTHTVISSPRKEPSTFKGCNYTHSITQLRMGFGRQSPVACPRMSAGENSSVGSSFYIYMSPFCSAIEERKGGTMGSTSREVPGGSCASTLCSPHWGPPWDRAVEGFL